ncbi:hypothetical protein [Ramlibacter sp. AN1133]|uniref:hypothetical protein n=1 Tax=Ramlibacter sp. AN1133 TaxID=3133429 RepID=UPI0030C3E29C
MSEPADADPDKDAPALQPAPVGRHGNSGEGAASVLRALRQGPGQRTNAAPERERQPKDDAPGAPESSRHGSPHPRA